MEKSITFEDLHYIIQIAMGWENSHLHEFQVQGKQLGMILGDESFFELDENLIDDNSVKLESMITEEKQEFIYIYDFGDDWRHTIVVEKFLPRDGTILYPICTDGKMNCPPEDCGGIGGFYYMLKALSDKNHPEYENFLEWIGDDYDMKFFDKETINEDLAIFAGHKEKKRKK